MHSSNSFTTTSYDPDSLDDDTNSPNPKTPPRPRKRQDRRDGAGVTPAPSDPTSNDTEMAGRED
jgi:hypothetical protein